MPGVNDFATPDSTGEYRRLDRPGGDASWVIVALSMAATAVAIVALGPYFAWTSVLYFRLSIVLFSVLFVLASSTGEIGMSRRNIGLTALLLLLMTYYASHPRGGVYDPSSGWLALILFVLLPDPVKASTYRCFVWAFALSLVPAIIVWLLSAAGINVPWTYLYAKRLDADFLLGQGGSYYRQYIGSVVRGNLFWTMSNGSTFFRLHGLYEEPGLVGTIAALILVANRFRFKGHLENWIVLAGGLMSFSIAFFAIAYLSLLWRRPVVTTAVTVVLVGAAVALDLPAKMPLLRLLIFDRLSVSGGVIAGDNRVTPLFAALYQDFWKAGLVTTLFGSTRDISTVVDTGAFSYKVLIYQYGLLGFVGLVSWLSTALISVSRRKDAFILLATLLVSIYQRPNVLSLPFIIILLGGAARLNLLRVSGRHHTSPGTDYGSPVVV